MPPLEPSAMTDNSRLLASRFLALAEEIFARADRVHDAGLENPIPMTETSSNRHDDIGTSPRCPTEVIENEPICLCFPCCIRDLSCLDLALLPPRITSCLRPSQVSRRTTAV